MILDGRHHQRMQPEKMKNDRLSSNANNNDYNRFSTFEEDDK